MDNQGSQQVPAQNLFIRDIPSSFLKSFLSTKIILLITTFLIIIGTGGTYFVLNSKTKTQPIESRVIPTSTPTATPTEASTPTPTLEPTPTPAPSPTPISTPTPTLTPVPTPTPTPTPVWGTPGNEYANMVIATERGNFSIDVILIGMSGAQMVTDTANDSNCGDNCPTKSLASFVSLDGGFAGINGTYFCPPDYSECASKKNSFDFPVYNSRLNKWINGANLTWNDRSIIYQDGSGMHFNRDAKKEWYLTLTAEPPRCIGNSCVIQSWPKVNLKAAIVNSPGLLENGNVIADQFPLTDKQKSKGTKGGIGFNGNNVYLVVARNVGMADFGYVFKALGARYALNLDGGGSSALWLGGYKAGPGRSLPNAVVFLR